MERVVAQIAFQSGLPPSQIFATWSIEELRTQVTLARLEGRGRDVFRQAELLAEIHNAVRWAVWQTNGSEEQPTWMKPSNFIPKVPKPKPSDQEVRKQLQKDASFLNSLAGF